MKISALVASVALLAGAAPAFAADLVTNGGFETGDTSGWTAIGNNATSYNYIYTGNPHTGSFDYRDGNYPGQGLAGLSQSLATTAGSGYDISLSWLATGSNDTANQLYQILWNGAVVGQISGAAGSGTYTNLVYHVFAVGGDTLAFQGFSTSGYNQTDDVSVVGNGLTASVPEPASWAMFIGGFGLIGGAMRNRRKETRPSVRAIA